MSAQFKNSKRKLSQAELRRFMNEHKNKVKVAPKINSPLAKYNDLGQLTCVLCQSVVRSETVWTVHINSKQHKEKVEHAKKLKEKTNNFTTPLKRPLTPPLDVPTSTKKLKGILKNSSNESDDTSIGSSGVPMDFFDNNAQKQKMNKLKENNKRELEDEKMQIEEDPSAPIPEGFFDDPKKDAKARNIDYKDPIEEEWEKFQIAIRNADNESATIIADDQQEATNERQIDEIDEQMKNWSRVVTLEKQKTEIISTIPKDSSSAGNEDLSDNEINFDEYLDWRSKKSFKR